MENAQPASLAGAGGGRRRRRAIPILDARFQWKYTLIITALGAGITAIMGSFLYRAHADNTRLLELEGNVQLEQQVVRGDQIFLLYLLILVIMMALALAFWGLVVTHRVSGPLHVIARHFGALADGRYPDLRPLRKHDELQEFFGAFEDAVAGLRGRDRTLLQSLEEAIVAARRALDSNPKNGLEDALRALEHARTTLNESLRGD
jgi:HAMP domain-containing protein